MKIGGKIAVISTVLGVTLGAIILAARQSLASEEEGQGASIKLAVRRQRGGEPAFSLIEGEVAVLTAIITNNSTKSGKPWGASMSISADIIPGLGIYGFSVPSVSYDFAAGETKTLTFSVPLPLGSGGMNGAARVSVKDPSGALIVNADIAFPITVVPIHYGAIVNSPAIG